MRISPVGLRVEDLDTPALLLDLSAFHHNVGVMSATICGNGKGRGLKWRPHAKAFKTPAIAWELIRAGAMGVTTAKVSEAEVMASAGVPEILVAHLVVGQSKCARAAALARGMGALRPEAGVFPLTVTVDHPAHVEPLGRAAAAAGGTIGVLLDVNVGMNRGGAETPEEAVRLGVMVQKTRGLAFRGLMGYEGHTLLIVDPEEKRAAILLAMQRLARVRVACEEAGLTCSVVSVGGTGSYPITTELAESRPDLGITEIQAGGGVFACRYYTHACHIVGHKPALSVLATVVSVPGPDRIILNAGKKSLSDAGAAACLKDFPDARMISLSAEHAIAVVPQEQHADFSIGQRIEITPGYSDLTFVLHDRVLIHQHGTVLADWPLLGRGMLQ